ncbi:MAG: hypothetical protein HOG49_09640 [Candidatus Scalindua sp.]|nr:hypothetical protein [Candidatus Scalindua sp.]
MRETAVLSDVKIEGFGLFFLTYFASPLCLLLIRCKSIVGWAFGREEIKELQYTLGIASFLKDGFEDFMKD